MRPQTLQDFAGQRHLMDEGKVLRDVAPVPRHLLDADGYVLTMEDGTLARQPVDVVAYQGDAALVRNTVPEGTAFITTILQKPLVGMNIRSTNMPDLNADSELADSEEGADSELAEKAAGTEPASAGG